MPRIERQKTKTKKLWYKHLYHIWNICTKSGNTFKFLFPGQFIWGVKKPFCLIFLMYMILAKTCIIPLSSLSAIHVCHRLLVSDQYLINCVMMDSVKCHCAVILFRTSFECSTFCHLLLLKSSLASKVSVTFSGTHSTILHSIKVQSLLAWYDDNRKPASSCNMFVKSKQTVTHFAYYLCYL